MSMGSLQDKQADCLLRRHAASAKYDVFAPQANGGFPALE
jgi:hypothetical protein